MESVDYKKVKFSHFRDGNWGLTIARIFDRDKKTVKYGWAANVPARKFQALDEKGNQKTVRIKGDMFCKRVGREMAVARLETSPITLKLTNDVLPVVAVLEDMEDNPSLPLKVQYLAAVALDDDIHCFTYSQLKAESMLAKSAGTGPKVGRSFLDRFVNWLRGKKA